MDDLRSIKGFNSFAIGVFVGSTVTAIFSFKNIKKRLISFAETIITYDRNLSILSTREDALIELLDPVIPYLTEEAIDKYNTTVEFLELVHFNDIGSDI